MKPLKILIASGQAPLPNGSAAGRGCHALIGGLSGRGHKLRVLTACSDALEAENARDLYSKPGDDLTCFPPRWQTGLASKLETLRRPMAYLFSPQMIDCYRTACRDNYDVLHIEGTFTAYLKPRHEDARTVLNVHNLYGIDWPAGYGNYAENARRLLAIRAERKLIQSCRSVIAVTPQLARQISAIAPQSSVNFVPLALDPAPYTFIPIENRMPRPVVSLIGSMDWFPSRSAAERLLNRIWPAIKKRMPEAKLEITGRRARTALAAYLDREDVSIEENVPSIQPYFERATILLYAPDFGTGVKVKVLEAFAMGVPVVTTPDGVDGIDAQDGVHAIVADTEPALVDRALQLLCDPAMQERQRLAARKLIDTYHTPDSVAQRLENVYLTLPIHNRRDVTFSTR